MTIEERLAHLAEHGVGCPQAVKLGGPASIEAWAEQQEVTLEAALADAEAADAADAEAVDARTEEAARVRADTEERAAAAVEGAGGPEAVETTLTGDGGMQSSFVPDPTPTAHSWVVPSSKSFT